MRADLRNYGPAATLSRYLVAGGTNIQAGEPLHTVGDTHSSGAASVNTSVLAAADTPVIGTHSFRGVAMKKSLNAAAGTVLAQWLDTFNPVPNVGCVVGKAETAASVDTFAEAVLLVDDFVLIDYNATGASDGGELYTIKEVASADTSGLAIVYINPATQNIYATPAVQAYRSDVS